MSIAGDKSLNEGTAVGCRGSHQPFHSAFRFGARRSCAKVIVHVLTDNYDKTSPQHRVGQSFFTFLNFVITGLYGVITNHQIVVVSAPQTRRR